AQLLSFPLHLFEMRDVGGVKRDRLFNQHMLSGAHRADGKINMRVGARADAHEINRFVGEQLLRALIRSHDIRIKRQLLRARIVTALAADAQKLPRAARCLWAANSDELARKSPRRGGLIRRDVSRTHEAEADYSDTNVHGRSSLEYWLPKAFSILMPWMG